MQLFRRNDMREIRLLALDIDGTILTGKKELTVRTKTAIEAVINRGITVVFVTGRPHYGVPDELLEVRGLRYLISSNGAITMDLSTRTVIRKATLNKDTALKVIEVPRELDLVYAVFMEGIGYCEPERFERHLKRVRGTPIEAYIRKSRRIAHDTDRLIRESPNEVENIWFLARDREQRDQLSRMIRETWNVQVVVTGEIDVEVGSPGADKGLALKDLADHLRVDRNMIMAIGDNGNDIGMLHSAGIAVAMGNAEEEVKRAADLITATNDENGAAMIMEQLIH